MKTLTFRSTLAALAVSAFAYSTAHATIIQPASDTFITDHAGLAGPNSTHPGDTFLQAIGAHPIGSDTYTAFPLVRFDLSAFAGQTVIGSPTLELFLTSVFPQATARIASVHAVLVPWNATTVTFNNFGGSPGVNFGGDVGSALDTESFVWNGSGDDRYITWQIPAATLQSWINSPSTNYGILISNHITEHFYDFTLASSEAANPPRLSFTVPEPSSALLLLSSAALCLRRRPLRTHERNA